MAQNQKLEKKQENAIKNVVNGQVNRIQTKISRYQGRELTKQEVKELEAEIDQVADTLVSLATLKILHGNKYKFKINLGKNQKDKNSKEFKFLTQLNGKVLSSKSFNIKTKDVDSLEENELSEKMAWAQLGGLISGSFSKLNTYLKSYKKEEFLAKYGTSSKDAISRGTELVAMCAVAEFLSKNNVRQAKAVAAYYGLTSEHFEHLQKYFNVPMSDSLVNEFKTIETVRDNLEKQGFTEEEIQGELQSAVKGTQGVLEQLSGNTAIDAMAEGDTREVISYIEESYGSDLVAVVKAPENGRIFDIAEQGMENRGNPIIDKILSSPVILKLFEGKESRSKGPSPYGSHITQEKKQALGEKKESIIVQITSVVKEKVQELKQQTVNKRENYLEEQAQKQAKQEKRESIDNLTKVIESGTLSPEKEAEARKVRNIKRIEFIAENSVHVTKQVNGKTYGPLAYIASQEQKGIQNKLLDLMDSYEKLQSAISEKEERGAIVPESEKTMLKGVGQEIVYLQGQFNPKKILSEEVEQELKENNDYNPVYANDAAERRQKITELKKKIERGSSEDDKKQLIELLAEQEKEKIKHSSSQKAENVRKVLGELKNEKESEVIKTSIISSLRKEVQAHVGFLNSLQHKEGLGSVDFFTEELSRVKTEVQNNNSLSDADKTEVLAEVQKCESLIAEAKARVNSISNESSKESFNQAVIRSITKNNPQLNTPEAKKSLLNVIGLVNVAGLSKGEQSSMVSKISDAVGSTPIEKVEKMVEEPANQSAEDKVEENVSEKQSEEAKKQTTENTTEESSKQQVGGDALFDEAENGLPENQEAKGMGSTVQTSSLESGEMTEQQMQELGMVRRPDDVT